jgi:hypothetical protein
MMKARDRIAPNTVAGFFMCSGPPLATANLGRLPACADNADCSGFSF